MTTLQDHPAGPAAERSAPAHARPSGPTTRQRLTALGWSLVVPLVLVQLTIALRVVNLTTSYDLFIDEDFYVTVGKSVAAGGLPYGTGSYFFLHPPGHSVLEAIWIHLVGTEDGVFGQVFSMRYMNVFFAAVTTLLLYVFGRRVSGAAAGTVAATIFTISPWFIRQNSFVLLETSTLVFVLGAWLLVLHLPRSPRRRLAQLVLVGLLMGFGVLIKEFAVFATLLPLAIIAWRGWVLTRREAAIAAGFTCVPYATWLVVILVTGHVGEFWSQNLAGFRRAAGAEQISGFNAPNAPSFLSTVIGSAPQFATTYALLGLGSLALLLLLVRGRTPELRVLAAFGVGAMPLLAYSVLLGANEEQFYYYLVIPSALAVGVVLTEGWSRLGRRGARVVTALALVWVVSDLVNWAVVHTTPDNGTQQVDAWMRDNVVPGTPVAVTNDVQRQIFLRYGMVDFRTPQSLDGTGVQYLVVFEKQVEQGYAFTDPESLATVVGDRTPVFSTDGRGNGRIDVFKLS